MQQNSKALEKSIEYKAKVENLLGKTIKIFWSDRGGEYMDLKFEKYMIEHEISS